MKSPILETRPLQFVWETADPFLFCVHHHDAYPKGNGKLGPAASLAGRDIGQDFEGKDGWRMYHGDTVPGFPQHPHRGFETVTFVRRGLIDHSDSLGATARFGAGDTQWLTAGEGIVHSEMFPLLKEDAPNPLELFQIWLNLPKADKFAKPHFSMLWAQQTPRRVFTDVKGLKTEVTIVAGKLGDATPPPPPPRSWASRPDSDVAIWSIRMEPGATWALPPAPKGVNRTVYFFEGKSLRVAEHESKGREAMVVDPEASLELVAGETAADVLLLQGRPIGEPVAQHGPFVMNSRSELQQAFMDYQRTQFGGWPFGANDPVHAASEGRFAKHADGRLEHPSPTPADPV